MAKNESLTARRAFVCGELEQRRTPAFFQRDLSLRLHPRSIHEATAAQRWRPDDWKSPGRKASEPIQRLPELEIYRDWQLVREERLDVGRAAVLFETTSRAEQVAIHRRLESIDGVRQLVAFGRRRLLAIVLYHDPVDEQRLSALLDDCGDYEWFALDEESWAPAIGTWRHLTEQAARQEGLLAGE